MITINKNTKKGRYFIYAYNYSQIYDIYEAYSRPSSAKVQAYEYCCRMCQQENGEDFRIISAGCQFFSAAWRVSEGLRVETYANSYIIK